MIPAGELLVGLGAVLVWATETGGGIAWTAFAVGALAVAAAAVGKYLLAGRHLTSAGVRRSTLVRGGALGVVGFFVAPVVGLPLGFALLVEFAGALVATGAWLLAVLLA